MRFGGRVQKAQGFMAGSLSPLHRTRACHIAPTLTPVLFQQGHAVDEHPQVQCFAPVVNRQQGHLHGGEAFCAVDQSDRGSVG